MILQIVGVTNYADLVRESLALDKIRFEDDYIFELLQRSRMIAQKTVYAPTSRNGTMVVRGTTVPDSRPLTMVMTRTSRIGSLSQI